MRSKMLKSNFFFENFDFQHTPKFFLTSHISLFAWKNHFKNSSNRLPVQQKAFVAPTFYINKKVWGYALYINKKICPAVLRPLNPLF